MKAWVKGGGGQKQCFMSAKDYGGSEVTANIGDTNYQWLQITISNINVTNGKCTIGLWSDAYGNNWINVLQNYNG